MILNDISIKGNTDWISLLELVYPIGSLYCSSESESPASRLGGTWAAIEGKLLGAIGDNYISAETCGSKTIAGNQMPAHTHYTYSTYSGRVGENGSGSTDGVVWGVRLSNTWRLSTGSAGGGRISATNLRSIYVDTNCLTLSLEEVLGNDN